MTDDKIWWVQVGSENQPPSEKVMKLVRDGLVEVFEDRPGELVITSGEITPLSSEEVEKFVDQLTEALERND